MQKISPARAPRPSPPHLRAPTWTPWTTKFSPFCKTTPPCPSPKSRRGRPVADALLEAHPETRGDRRRHAPRRAAVAGKTGAWSLRLCIDRRRRTFRRLARALHQASRQNAEVVEFHRMAGDVDYMLRVVVADMAAFDAFYKRLISITPLRNVVSRFAMERIKSTTALPFPRPWRRPREPPASPKRSRSDARGPIEPLAGAGAAASLDAKPRDSPARGFRPRRQFMYFRGQANDAGIGEVRANKRGARTMTQSPFYTPRPSPAADASTTRSRRPSATPRSCASTASPGRRA